MGDTEPAFDDGLGDFQPSSGPWSLADAPADATFLDFGPLRLPGFGGTRARLEFDRKTKRAGAVTVRISDCEVQFQVIAAPRGASQWTDTRTRLTANLRTKPGHVHAVEGRYGPELLATMTGRRPGGELFDVPIRYQGIDGERWMLKVMIVGPSVTKDATVARINDYISLIGIDRGSEPIAAGTVLELAWPQGMPKNAPDAPQEDA